MGWALKHLMLGLWKMSEVPKHGDDDGSNDDDDDEDEDASSFSDEEMTSQWLNLCHLWQKREVVLGWEYSCT